jgi:hypothetical protein
MENSFLSLRKLLTRIPTPPFVQFILPQAKVFLQGCIEKVILLPMSFHQKLTASTVTQEEEEKPLRNQNNGTKTNSFLVRLATAALVPCPAVIVVHISRVVTAA